MNPPTDTGESPPDPSSRMHEGIAMMRERWSRLPRRRRRVLFIVVGGLLLITLLRHRSAPLVQVNVEITFRPVATTAVSLFGAANAGRQPGDEDAA